MNKSLNKNKGMSLVKVLIIGFILIFILGYFKINIKTVVESPDSQDNLNYVKGTGTTIWQRYLEKPASYLWNDIFVNIFWKAFILNMEKIRDGQPTDYEQAAPIAPLNEMNSNLP